jgi:hypothetical protein
MTKLVTDAMMTRLRDVAETGLQTEVSILNRSIIEGTNGNEETYKVFLNVIARKRD